MWATALQNCGFLIQKAAVVKRLDLIRFQAQKNQIWAVLFSKIPKPKLIFLHEGNISCDFHVEPVFKYFPIKEITNKRRKSIKNQ